MGLFREPMLRALLALLLVMASALWLSLENSRDYLQTQTQAQMQDNATSTALAMRPLLVNDNLLIAETMVNTLVNTGNYATIMLQDEAGEVLIKRDANQIPPTVPTLFMHWFHLEIPNASAQVPLGSDSIASVTITGINSSAYQHLWDLAQRLMGLYAACMLLAAALLWQWARGKQQLLKQRCSELGHVITELRDLNMHHQEDSNWQHFIFEQGEDPTQSTASQPNKRASDKKLRKKQRRQELAPQ